jgi:hypothetical protein
MNKYLPAAIFVLISSVLIPTISIAQNVGINADTSLPNSSAMLDVKSSNKGVLIPRVALTGTNDVTTIANPATSLLVYNTANITGTQGVTPGYYYWTGAAWLQLAVTKEYAYIYNTGSYLVRFPDAVTFSANGNMTNGISHIPGSSSIIFKTPGVYKIEFSVSANETNQFFIIKNGNPVPVAGSTYLSASANQQNTGMVIVDIFPTDIIQLRSNSSNIFLSGGGAVVNASIMITQL